MKVETFAEVLDELHRKKLGQLFVRKSRENYLEAIKLALALYYSVQNEPTALQGLAAEANYRVTKRTDAAQIAVRVVIDYGKTDEDRRTNRQYASRDALALKHLAEQGISPNQVVELGKKRGQGLEAWGRTNRRRRSETKRLDSSANVTRLVKSAGKVQRCAIGRVTVADDAMTFLKRFQKEGPIWFRENGVDGAVWALVAVRLPKINPKTRPIKTRRLLSIGLADYLKKLKIMATDKALYKDDCRRLGAFFGCNNCLVTRQTADAKTPLPIMMKWPRGCEPQPSPHLVESGRVLGLSEKNQIGLCGSYSATDHGLLAPSQPNGESPRMQP